MVWLDLHSLPDSELGEVLADAVARYQRAEDGLNGIALMQADLDRSLDRDECDEETTIERIADCDDDADHLQ